MSRLKKMPVTPVSSLSSSTSEQEDSLFSPRQPHHNLRELTMDARDAALDGDPGPMEPTSYQTLFMCSASSTWAPRRAWAWWATSEGSTRPGEVARSFGAMAPPKPPIPRTSCGATWRRP